MFLTKSRLRLIIIVQFQIFKISVVFRIKLVKKIGEGEFGIVYMARMASQPAASVGDVKMKIAIKTLRDDSSNQEIKNFIRELLIMRSIDTHENIIRLLGISVDHESGKVVACLEFAKYGNLKDYLRDKKSNNKISSTITNNMDGGPGNLLSVGLMAGMVYNTSRTNLISRRSSLNHNYDDDSDESNSFISSRDLVLFAYQIANGMDYLHGKKLIHRDLAARNVLVCDNRVAKIADFGLAGYFEENYYVKRHGDGRLPIKWSVDKAASL